MLKKINYKNTFAVQIGDGFVRLADVCELSGGVKIRSYVKRELPLDALERGAVKKHKTVAQIVERAVHDCKPAPIKKRRVVCVVPESRTFIKVLEMPYLEGEEANEAVKWEMEDNIPLPVERVYYDWEMIEGSSESKRMKVLVVATPKEVIDSRVSVFESAGFLVVGFWPESFALGTCFNGIGDGDKNTAIVYFGQKMAVIVVRNKGQVFFSSSIPFGVRDLEKEILAKLLPKPVINGSGSGVETNSASGEKVLENFRRQGVAPGADGQNSPFYEVAKEAAGDLIREIKSAINYFEKDQEIGNIYLTGEGAAIQGLGALLTAAVEQEIKAGLEFEGLVKNKEKMGMPLELMNEYVVVLGAGIYPCKDKVLNHGNSFRSKSNK